ncbi:hypothetical protein BX600DRAFT_396899 [Xylariales sp. PMI_506]|nr:hypothetical protein BX600DRAFT_396899 [Xylariales sp. PMI_506]
MKRIRQALARLSKTRKPSPDSSSSHSSESLVSSRRSIDDGGVGALVLHQGNYTAAGNESGLDIVFVHCLGGNRITSWQKNGVCWPADLLGRELPDARIITWGYSVPDALMAAVSQKHTYADIATYVSDALIADLIKVSKKSNRDIIFVAHGVGGHIVKDALCTTAVSQVFGKYNEHGNLYSKTAGIIFLGTPHRAHGKGSFGEAVASIAELEVGPNYHNMLEMIRNHNDMFETQRDEFILVTRDLPVVCIRELLPTPPLTRVFKHITTYDGLNVVVDDVYANHWDVARFSSRQDPGYFQLVGHLSKLSRRIEQEGVEAKLTRNREILDALHFDMHNKQDSADEAHGRTCASVLSATDGDQQVSDFYHWLRTPGSIFWISGNPGSGKTTLMKHAFYSKQTRERLESWAGNKQLVMASIFLFEGGTHVQKSHEGILRGLLYQILSARQDLIPICFPSFMSGAWPPPVPFNTVLNLSQAFYQLFSRMAGTMRLAIFIDALDEYRMAESEDHSADSTTSMAETSGDEAGPALGSKKWIADSHIEIAGLITEMASSDFIKLCVSSRELPHFEEAFMDVPRLRVHTKTEKMIAQYCADRLDYVAPGLSVSQRSLCIEVAQKSRGDILWARLTIDILMEGSLKKLKSTLDSLPTHLGGTHGLYMRIIQNLAPSHQREGCRIFEIILRSLDPPHPLVLAFADEGYLAKSKLQREHPEAGELLISHDKLHPFTVQDLRNISERLEHRLTSCCAGLLETTEKQQRVVFMHLTAKEFVFKGHIWDRILVTPPSKTEIDFSLISGNLRYLSAVKSIRPLVSGGPRFQFEPEAWVMVSNILRYANRVDDESFDDAAYIKLLDDLDATCSEAWATAIKQHVPAAGEDPEWHRGDGRYAALLSSHWAGFEPMELGPSPLRHDFLALALQANLYNYVHEKLMGLGSAERAQRAQRLLEYAVCPEGDTRSDAGSSVSASSSLTGNARDFHHDMPDTKFVHLLFECGADAQQASARDVWVRTLSRGRTFFSGQHLGMLNLSRGSYHALAQNRQRWVAAVTALLAGGVDPHLQVETGSIAAAGSGGGGALGGGLGSEGSSTEAKPAIDVVKNILEGEKEFAKDLIVIEALAVKALAKAK